ncbi:MAG: carbohydrate ABC transporter permease [Clostridia bacterium]|nr:carbohydrate ABC transporter permease [Clostridia bacterium]
MTTHQKQIKYVSIVLVCIFLLIALFPIYWMFNTSLKSQFEVYQRVPTMFPKQLSLDGYRYLYSRTPFLRSLLNSFIVGISTAAFSLVVGYPAAYALSRIKFRGRMVMAKGVLYTYLIPTSVLYIPLFMLVSKADLSDSLLGLILIYPTFTLPYTVWMLIPHVGSVPKSIEEASVVDGCTRIQTMLRIVFPLAKPGIISTCIFAFSMCWGEYLYALVNISSSASKTYTLVISGLVFGDIYPWAQIMAGAITACLPILLVYMFASKFLVGGVTAGGVKQ